MLGRSEKAKCQPSVKRFRQNCNISHVRRNIIASDPDNKKRSTKNRGSGVAIGIAVGLAIGTLIDNTSTGIEIGIALGLGIGTY